MNKKILCTFLMLCMVAALAACADKDHSNVGDTLHLQGSPDNELFSDMEHLSTFETRTLLSETFPSTIPLASNETFSLELPFPADNAVYTTDDANIVSVDKTGLVTPVGSGEAMVHIDVNGLQHHIIFQVSGDTALSDGTVYQAFDTASFDAQDAVEELEVYASSVCGMTVQESLKESEDNILYTNEFSAGKASSCATKYKLLTTLDYLSDSGAASISVDFVQSEDMIVCHFYGAK